MRKKYRVGMIAQITAYNYKEFIQFIVRRIFMMFKTLAPLIVIFVIFCSQDVVHANIIPDFGPHTLIFDPSMPMGLIQTQLDKVFQHQETNQFGQDRYAILFKPGHYNLDVNVGFYTQVLGLGLTPDSVTINGAVRVEADWFYGNATHNFWRGAENMTVDPVGGANRWAVSQAAPLRRMHIRGDLLLDDGGWSSGGFIADTLVDKSIYSGSQQQYFTRNSSIESWIGFNWNMVFTGVKGVSSAKESWPNPPNTVVSHSSMIREKPYLAVNDSGEFVVIVPPLSQHQQGISWGPGSNRGQSISINDFYIAKPSKDNASSINRALSSGKHLLFTPGIYHLNETLIINKKNTVVLSLGLSTLIPDNGIIAMSVADVDGVKIAGLLFDAGTVNSPILLEVGPSKSKAHHENNPTSLHDLYFRVGGGQEVGKASVSLKINSHHVIGDHFWVWRADHGNAVGWDLNTAANGLIVNGDDVTIYGLFVEHFQEYQTLWNGNGGKVFFYQSEIPYDVPSQSAWMNEQAFGFASYKVAENVTTHEAWGMGVYCFFYNPLVKLDNAIEAPLMSTSGEMFHGMTTVSLGGMGEITNIKNGTGPAANAQNMVGRLWQ
jgi:hypothetical protein